MINGSGGLVTDYSSVSKPLKGKSNSYYLTAISTWMMLIIDKMTLILVEIGLIVYIQN